MPIRKSRTSELGLTICCAWPMLPLVVVFSNINRKANFRGTEQDTSECQSGDVFENIGVFHRIHS